jgi:hypothetical protein
VVSAREPIAAKLVHCPPRLLFVPYSSHAVPLRMQGDPSGKYPDMGCRHSHDTGLFDASSQRPLPRPQCGRCRVTLPLPRSPRIFARSRVHCAAASHCQRVPDPRRKQSSHTNAHGDRRNRASPLRAASVQCFDTTMRRRALTYTIGGTIFGLIGDGSSKLSGARHFRQYRVTDQRNASFSSPSFLRKLIAGSSVTRHIQCFVMTALTPICG